MYRTGLKQHERARFYLSGLIAANPYLAHCAVSASISTNILPPPVPVVYYPFQEKLEEV
jgi:hypothetical protein